MNTSKIIDCHVHSNFSADSNSTMEKMCETAFHKGLCGITFTDHIDSEKEEILNNADARKEYIASISELKERYGLSLTILCSYELSAPHKDIQGRLADLLNLTVDSRMISVHHGDLDIPITDEKRYVSSYLKEAEAAVLSGNYDVLGHIDLLRRIYGEFSYNKAQLEQLYCNMINKKMALEVNTHSFKKCGTITKKDLEYVEIWKSCGGKHIVLGSDAHDGNILGCRFEEILLALPFGIEIGHYANKQFVVDEILN